MTIRCFVCGDAGRFVDRPGDSQREAACTSCGAKRRSSDLASVILQTLFGDRFASLREALPALAGFRIFEAQAAGAVHDVLSALPGYICAEYLDGVNAGACDAAGVRNEDLHHLSFAAASFDLVITQDVMEHVARPERAFQEVQRVLKPGGWHLFTVPVHEGRATRRRIAFEGDRRIECDYVVHHGDPLRDAGSLVHTDFGDDLPAYLADLGIPAELIHVQRFYTEAQIPWLASEETHADYLAAVAAGTVPAFFLYNSVVARSWKPEAMSKVNEAEEFTGERYLPTLDWPEVAFEHWHRYLLAAEYLTGLTVLDIACGEGYGSQALAARADRVVAVDISVDTVEQARRRYSRDNLEFVCGSCVGIPVQGTAVFDAVVSFETLEHLSALEQRRFLEEVKRVLKPDGLFIVSTPNKRLYSDAPGYCNPHHVKEYMIDEFAGLLAGQFARVKLLGQRIYPVSYIWPADGQGDGFVEFGLEYRDGTFQPTAGGAEMLYAIALCSNREVAVGGHSVLVDLSSAVMAHIGKLEDHGRHLEAEIVRVEGERDASAATVGRLIEELARVRMAADDQAAALEGQLLEQAEYIRRLTSEERNG